MAILRPTGPIHPDGILLDDPGRAMLVAQALIDGPLMGNHAFGLWSYYGHSPQTGGEIGVHSCGFGAASLAEVTIQLAELGLRRVIRIASWWEIYSGDGSHLADSPGPLVVGLAHGGDEISTSLSRGNGSLFRPADELGNSLLAQPNLTPAVTATSSLRVPPARFDPSERLAAAGAGGPYICARDDATATLYALAPGLGLEAAAILVAAAAGEEKPGDPGELPVAAAAAAEALCATG